MHRSPLALLALSISLLSCGEKTSTKSDKSSAAEEEEPPFTGPLTIERVMKAKGKVDTFDEWSGAYEKLERFLGKPTKTKGTKVGWAVSEGDTCAYLYAEKEDRAKYIKGEKGDMVGTYMAPMRVEKGGAIMNYAECIEWTGKEVGPPEDGKAIAPPTDGSTVPLQTVIDNAIAGRSKWDKQQVNVSALANGINVSVTNNDPSTETIIVNMVADQKAGQTIGCTLVKGTPKPDLPGAFEPLVAKGTIAITKWVNGAGESGYAVNLESCTVTFLGKAGAASASVAPSATPPKK